MTQGRVLIVAGSDSGGGAGIQGDIKTVAALGGYAMTAITALTAQNTTGVYGIHPVPPEFVAQQMRVCLDDLGADAIKTGMLHSVAIIDSVVGHLPETTPLVVDPVMIAKGGAPLLEPAALSALRERLIPRATIITPNLPEAEWLLGRTITGDAEMIEAAHILLQLGPRAVLIKGGHAEGSVLTDILLEAGQPLIAFTAPRRDTRHTHGTGCALASAIATGLAQGLALAVATSRAHAFVQAAILAAPGFGQGNGPLGHHRMQSP